MLLFFVVEIELFFNPPELLGLQSGIVETSWRGIKTQFLKGRDGGV
jgi:hypothetical protein